MAESEKAKLFIDTVFEADATKSTQQFEEFNKSLAKIREQFKQVSKTTDEFFAKLTTPSSKAVKEVNILNKSFKALAKTLNSIKLSTAGIDALKNQSIFQGTKLNKTFGDLQYVKALNRELDRTTSEFIRLNRPISKLQELNYVKFPNIFGMSANDIKTAVKAREDTLLYETNVGRNALRGRFDKRLDKAVEDSTNYAIRNKTGLSADAVEDVKKTVRYSDSLALVQLRLMANYKAINLLTGGYKFLLNYTIQYDKELHQLQSIAAISDVGMRQLKDTIDAVATSTKFTSLEVAQAGTVLAQAGLSAKQIAGTLPAIAKLATATGTDLATSTDVITSTMNIYNLQTSEAVQVTNALTTAMNESKADIAGFQTAIQYAGNFASQLGMTYDETAASIAAATQAGIRSKSMLGTGLRAVMTEFLKPTKKLVAELEKVGLTVDDIDIKTRGFNNVLKTLKEAGFGATEAFRGMERRGAAFLVSLIKQTDFIDDLRMKMMGSTAAAKANETQMEALANQLDNLKSVMGTLAYNGVEPFIRMFSKLIDLINEFLGEKGPTGFNIAGSIGSILFGALGVAGGMAALAMLLSTLRSIFKVLTNIRRIAGIGLLGGADKLRGVASWVATVAEWAKAGPIIAAITAFTGLASAVYMVAKNLGLLDSAYEKSQARAEELKGETDEAKQSYETAQGMLERLYNSREKLSEQAERDIFFQEALSKFPQLIDLVDKTTLSFEELEDAIKRLNTLELKEFVLKMQTEAENKPEVEKTVAKEVGRGLMKEQELQGDFLFSSERERSRARNIGAYMNLINFLNNRGVLDSQTATQLMNTDSTINTIGAPIPGKLDEAKVGREKGLALDKAINQYIDDLLDSGKGMAEVTAELRIRAMEFEQKFGDASFTKMVDAIIDTRTKQYEAERATAQLKVRETEEALPSAYEDLTKSVKTATVAVDDYKAALKIHTQNEQDLFNTYKDLQNKLDQMEFLPKDEAGNAKSFRDYSDLEATRYLGYDSIEDFKRAFDSYTKSREGSGKTVEELKQEFLTNSQVRNSYLTQIINAIRDIKGLLPKTSAGQELMTQTSADKLYEKIEKDIGKASRYTGKGKDQNRKETLRNIQDYTTLALTNLAKKQSIDATKYTSSVKVVDDSGRLKDRDAFINDYKNNLVIGDGALGTKKAQAQLDNLGQQAGLIWDNAANFVQSMNGFTSTVTTGGEKFDAATERMNYFFSALEADVKRIETTYAEAEHALDTLVAKQQGRVTGAELTYGSNSPIVQAEQVRLKQLKDSQLSARTKNMQIELNDLIAQRNLLRDNPRFQIDDANFKQYEKAFLDAGKSGDMKAARIYQEKMNNMSSVYKQMASEDKKLTEKINKLQDSIDENTEALNVRTELDKMSTTDQMGLGLRSVATNYIDNTQKLGLDTIAGSTAYLADGVVNELDSGFTTMFTNIISNSKRAGDAFKDFGKQIITTIRDIAIQMAVKQGLSAIFSAFTGPQTVTSPTQTGTTSSGANFISGGSATYHQATGGIVNGPIKNRDSVPTKLMPGEYVLRKSAVDVIGRDYLDSLNSNAEATLNASAVDVNNSRDTNESNSNGGGGTVNVYVVGQEQQQAMTPNDVLVTITQDMMTGGQTKRLVKSIAMGAL